MNKHTFKFFIILLFSTLKVTAASVVVLDYVDQPKIKYISRTAPIAIKKQLIIASDFKIFTEDSQMVKIKINDTYEINILDKSEVHFYFEINKGKFYINQINLKKGRLHIRGQKKDQGSEIDFNVVSDFFDLKFDSSNKIDFIFGFGATGLIVDFCNGSKDVFPVRLYDHENIQRLEQNQAVSFEGYREKGKIVYDLLLANRKIPKGYWSDIKSCSLEIIDQLQKKFMDIEAEKKRKYKEGVLAVKLKKQQDDANFLCHKPYGQLNQCQWYIDSKRCYRSRCNAEGLWRDIQVVFPMHKEYCKGKVPVVQDCDY